MFGKGKTSITTFPGKTFESCFTSNFGMFADVCILFGIDFIFDKAPLNMAFTMTDNANFVIPVGTECRDYMFNGKETVCVWFGGNHSVRIFKAKFDNTLCYMTDVSMKGEDEWFRFYTYLEAGHDHEYIQTLFRELLKNKFNVTIE